MLTSTPWCCLLFNKNKILKQINPMLLIPMGYFFLSKVATTSIKPIYKYHGQQWGIFFSLFFNGATTFVNFNYYY
jgi:hypothetical protein